MSEKTAVQKTPVQKQSGVILPEDQVRLPAILGIRPGIYLAVLYGLIILLVLFFITLYPGLSNPGTVLKVISEPAGAAVRVDGVYMKAAPCEIFIPKGKHAIEVVLPGFTGWKEEIEFEGAVFCSRFFPARQSINVEIKSPNPVGAFINTAAEFAEWSFYGESTLAFQVPLVLSEGAYRLGPEAKNPATRAGMKDTLNAAARFSVTRSSIRDLLRAKFLLDNNGLSPSPLSLLDSVEEIIAFLADNPQSALWLGEFLPVESVAMLKTSPWYTAAANNKELLSQTGSIGRSIETFGGLQFSEITPQESSISSFFIAESPVSTELWELFLEETPEWRAENRQALMENGLVNSQYLSYAEFPGLPLNIAAWVSWHAARAWCEWYNTKLQTGFTGYIVSLPMEAEWEIAAKTGISRTGEFWEWCEDPFVPNNFLAAPLPAFDPGSPERPVRGGSWINARNTVNMDTRGSLPPDSCSPFVSFRPVIAQRNTR